MTFALRIGFAITLLFSVKTQAQICEIQQARDSQGNERILKISLPDGRRLTVVAHRHVFREDSAAISQLTNTPGMFSQVRQLLNKPLNKEALKQLREDRAILRRAISEGAEFAGVETGAEHAQAWKAHVGALRDRMLRYSSETGESDVRLISDAMLSLIGAPGAMAWEEPGLLRKVPIVGFENNKAGMAEYALHKDWAKFENEVLSAMRDDPQSKQIFNQADDEFNFLTYAYYDPKKPGLDAQIMKNYLAYFPAQYHEALARYMSLRLKSAKLIFIRDQESAKNLLAQGKSGISFVGAMHAPQIMRRLRNACLSMARPATVSVNPNSPTARR